MNTSPRLRIVTAALAAWLLLPLGCTTIDNDGGEGSVPGNLAQGTSWPPDNADNADGNRTNGVAWGPSTSDDQANQGSVSDGTEWPPSSGGESGGSSTEGVGWPVLPSGSSGGERTDSGTGWPPPGGLNPDGSSAGGALACHFGIDDICASCVQNNCRAEWNASFGTGGACGDLVSCLLGCACGDRSCEGDCLNDDILERGCQDAAELVGDCVGARCPACDDDNTTVDDPPNVTEPTITDPPETTEFDCTTVVGTIGVGVPEEGALSESSQRGTPRDPRAYYAVYSLVLANLAIVQIDLMSDQFDSFLFLFDEDCILIQQDDDGGDNVDSSMIYEAANAGTVYVGVSTFGGGEIGAFTLSVSAQ